MQALTWPYFVYDCRLGGYSLPSRERPSVLVSRVSQARGHIVITLLDTREILGMSLGSRYGGISIYLFQSSSLEKYNICHDGCVRRPI
jgi:hypothetical protein